MSMRGRRSRPLGSVRTLLTGIESLPKLPPLGTSSSIDSSYVGIHGAAMGTPRPLGSPERLETAREKTRPAPSRNTSSSSRSEGSKSDEGSGVKPHVNHDGDKKQLKEAQVREKQLLGEVASLQKQIAALEQEVAEKMRTNLDLAKQIQQTQDSEAKYKELYEEEVRLHNDTKDVLSSTKNLLCMKEIQIDEMQQQHNKQLAIVNENAQKKYEEMEKAKNTVITSLEGKLKRLKSQMADALQGNSWERQQQLDELSKELQRATEESQMLQAKLRAMAKNSSKQGNAGCANCESLTAQVQHLGRTINEKDKSIRELKLLMSRFDKQLSQKEILKQRASERKGVK